MKSIITACLLVVAANHIHAMESDKFLNEDDFEMIFDTKSPFEGYEEYKIFFELESTTNQTSFTQYISHGYNRIPSLWGEENWNIYDEIEEGLFLGQIPANDFLEDFHNGLIFNGSGLVVSCNSMYELANIGSYTPVVLATDWESLGIEHHHLPFTDFSKDAKATLVLDTLHAMLNARAKNTPIYIHCKAGRGRSAMVAALYIALTNEQFTTRLRKIAHTDEKRDDLINLINDIADHMKEKRVQVSVGNKASLAIDLLENWIENNTIRFKENGEVSLMSPNNESEELYDTVDDFLLSRSFLSSITQSFAFKALHIKALSTEGYVRSSNRFALMKDILKAMYEDARNFYACLQNVVEAVKEANRNFEPVNELEKNMWEFIFSEPMAEKYLGDVKACQDERASLFIDLKEKIDELITQNVNNS